MADHYMLWLSVRQSDNYSLCKLCLPLYVVRANRAPGVYEVGILKSQKNFPAAGALTSIKIGRDFRSIDTESYGYGFAVLRVVVSGQAGEIVTFCADRCMRERKQKMKKRNRRKTGFTGNLADYVVRRKTECRNRGGCVVIMLKGETHYAVMVVGHNS